MTDRGPKSGANRILLVEDESLIALDMQEVLEDAGYTVGGHAARLDRALALASTEALDAAVLDVNLAGVPVWPVAEMLRQRGIPFLLVTGFSTDAGLPACCAGAPRLAKPFVASALLNKLAEVVKSGKIRAGHD